MKRLALHALCAALVACLLSCTVERFVPEGEHLLEAVKVRTDSRDVPSALLTPYVQQHANSKWFSVLKVPMSPYALAGTDSTRRINRFLWRIGERPVIYDARQAERTRAGMQNAVRNMGFFDAQVTLVEQPQRHRLRLTYDVRTGQRQRVSELEERIADEAIGAIIDSARAESKLSLGMPLDVSLLDAEALRIERLLKDRGYYDFNRSFVRFEADTTAGRDSAWLRLNVDPYHLTGDTAQRPHLPYVVRSVAFHTDSLLRRRTIREGVLEAKNAVSVGKPYCESDVQQTYANMAQMGAVLSSSIKFDVCPDDSTALEATINVVTNKPHTLNAEVEGTNSNGDLGAAVVLSYQNRNLMRGSELLNIKLRGAYEAIKGLDGYDAQNYIEYGVEASLQFPDLKIPGVSRDFRRRAAAVSEVSLMYDSQDRPEFHRRVLTGVWRYRWYADNRRRQHKIDLLDLNYVFMPWISQTFRTEYLENATSRNAILRYNYEDLFVLKLGYTLHLSSQALNGPMGNYGTNAWNMRINVEASGNFLYGMTSLFNTARTDDGHYTLLNLAYAQYAKGDFDFAKSFSFTPENSLALHLGLGIAYPYGNATVLPYEKRYYSGGANSVRGWSVRGLGPGSFQGTNGQVDFINQTGDIKLDMSVEYRSHLFWLIDGAAFIDAGNIWTIRDYEEQPGGQFRFDTFWQQIAVAYGLGVRLNFNYFILRLDGGMKAINPAYTGPQHYPIAHPNFKRDFQLHFAVGLPF